MKTVAFCTLGCKVNQYETEAMSEMFKEKGYKITSFEQKSDIYIINTCTVTATGDKKSRQMIRRAKSTNPEGIIAVVGCYAQVAADEIAKIVIERKYMVGLGGNITFKRSQHSLFLL